MKMKLFWKDKLNPDVYMFFDFIYFRWCKRSGNAWVLFEPICQFIINHPDCPHVRGWYFQLGYWGGDIAWKSMRCYER